MPELRAFNQRPAEADWGGFAGLNRAFHFTILAAADLPVLTAELERVWFLTRAYRAIYVGEPYNLARILAGDSQMIDALVDADHLVELHERHRASTLTVLEPLLR